MAQTLLVLLALLLAIAAAISAGTHHTGLAAACLLLAFVAGASATNTPPRQS